MDIKLFDSDKDSVALPSSNIPQIEGIKSSPVEANITGDEVKIKIIKEDTIVAPKNFILDFNNCKEINPIQKKSLQSLICKDGDTQLYLYNDKQGLSAIGMANESSVERIIGLIVRFVFNDEIRVYKDFKIGEPIKEVKTKDITKMRLNL